MNNLEVLDPSRTGHRAPVRERTTTDAPDRGAFASLIDRSRGSEPRDPSPKMETNSESDASLEAKTPPQAASPSSASSSDIDEEEAVDTAPAVAASPTSTVDAAKAQTSRDPLPGDGTAASASMISAQAISEAGSAVSNDLQDTLTPASADDAPIASQTMTPRRTSTQDAPIAPVKMTLRPASTPDPSDAAQLGSRTMAPTSASLPAETTDAPTVSRGGAVETSHASEPLWGGQSPATPDLSLAAVTSARSSVVSGEANAPTDVSHRPSPVLDVKGPPELIVQAVASPSSPMAAPQASEVEPTSVGAPSLQETPAGEGSKIAVAVTSKDAAAQGSEQPVGTASIAFPSKPAAASSATISVETSPPVDAAVAEVPSRILSAIPPVSQGSGYGARGRVSGPQGAGDSPHQGRISAVLSVPIESTPVLAGPDEVAAPSRTAFASGDMEVDVPEVSIPAADRRQVGVMATGITALATKVAAAAASTSSGGGMKAVLLEGSASSDAPSPGLPVEAGQVRIESFEAKVETLRAPTPRPDLAQSALRQLAQVQLSDGETRIALSPKGMGEILIELRTDENGRLQAVLRAENPAVLQALRIDREALLSSLSHAGAKLDGAGLSFGDFPGGGRGFGRQSDPDTAPRGASAGWEIDAVEVSIEPAPLPHRASLTGRLDILT